MLIWLADPLSGGEMQGVRPQVFADLDGVVAVLRAEGEAD